MIKIQGTRYMSDFEAKKAMAEVGKQLESKGYAIGTDGSLSVRIGPNAVWITAGDARKGVMTPDMMVKVDLDGRPMMGARAKELPEEMRIHLRVYRENPEVRAVVHGYPPAATGMGIRGMDIPAADFTKTLRKLGNIPVIPYTGGDGDALAAGACAKNRKGVLLQDNGCMAWGENPQEAWDMLEAMEYYGRVAAVGNCGGFDRKPDRRAAAAGRTECHETVAAGGTEESPKIPSSLSGVTALVKPGQRRQSPKMSDFSPHTSDVIHSIVTPKPTHSAKAVDKPKAEVMAEVVRRTMQNFHS